MGIQKIITANDYKQKTAVTKGPGSTIISVDGHPTQGGFAGSLATWSAAQGRNLAPFEKTIALPTASGVTKLFDSEVEGITLQNLVVDASGTPRVWINQTSQTAANAIEATLVSLNSFEAPIRTVHVQAVVNTTPVSIYGAVYTTPHSLN